MANIRTYYSDAPYSWTTYARVDVDHLTEAQKNQVVAYEVCDGGGGRCKCPARCTWAIIPLHPDTSDVDESDAEQATSLNAFAAIDWNPMIEAQRLAIRELQGLFQEAAEQMKKHIQTLKAQNKL